MAYIPPPTTHSSGSIDVPTSWIAVAIAVALYQTDEPTGEDIAMGVFLGAGLALLWPLSIVAGGIWLLVRHLTRPRTTITTPED